VSRRGLIFLVFIYGFLLCNSTKIAHTNGMKIVLDFQMLLLTHEQLDFKSFSSFFASDINLCKLEKECMILQSNKNNLIKQYFPLGKKYKSDQKKCNKMLSRVYRILRDEIEKVAGTNNIKKYHQNVELANKPEYIRIFYQEKPELELYEITINFPNRRNITISYLVDPNPKGKNYNKRCVDKGACILDLWINNKCLTRFVWEKIGYTSFTKNGTAEYVLYPETSTRIIYDPVKTIKIFQSLLFYKKVVKRDEIESEKSSLICGEWESDKGCCPTDEKAGVSIVVNSIRNYLLNLGLDYKKAKVKRIYNEGCTSIWDIYASEVEFLGSKQKLKFYYSFSIDTPCCGYAGINSIFQLWIDSKSFYDIKEKYCKECQSKIEN